jgi:uncharacterized membrane protein
MLITHGRNRVTYSALIGSVSSVLITIIITYITITKASITGFIDDVDSGLFFATGGELNFTLLTIAGVIIGVIGVVDDASITQASAVRELKATNGNLTDLEYWKIAMRIGQDHAGAMINTLVMAYVSASLPVLLLFYNSTNSLMYLINKEINVQVGDVFSYGDNFYEIASANIIRTIYKLLSHLKFHLH